MMRDALKTNDEQIAYTLLRLVVGMNLMMHGVARILAGPGKFAAKLVEQFAQSPLPTWSVGGFAAMLPVLEGILGLLLLIGLRTRAVLIVSSFLILVLTFGSTLVQDWSVAGSQLLYALVYSLLLFLHRYDAWSIDRLMQR